MSERADERGLRHWADLADRLTREAALRAARGVAEAVEE